MFAMRILDLLCEASNLTKCAKVRVSVLLETDKPQTTGRDTLVEYIAAHVMF